MSAPPISAGVNISVIIPTYNRPQSLLQTLDSIVRQSYPAEQLEVIVVDDGGTVNTDAITEVSFPFKFVFHRQNNQGSAIARNSGVHRSCGKILVFIDDDMTLDSEYLAEIANRSVPETILMGKWQPYQPSRQSPFSKVAAQPLKIQDPISDCDQEVPFSGCTSNNLAVQRADFMCIGMWQDILGDGPTLWGDVEFGYRAWKMGCRFVRVANAKLIHRDIHTTDLVSAAKRAYHVSKNVQPLFELHPEIEDHLPMFQDKRPILWGQDSPRFIGRKLARRVAASRLALWAMEQTVRALEQYHPSPTMLRPLYRWVIGGYIFRGYRKGLTAYGKP